LRKDTDFIVDEKGHSVTLTEEGVDRVEAALHIGNLFDPENIDFLHHVNQALKAHNLYKREINYMVTENQEILIIDEFTGRTMPGRRWSDGLHQAVEAKENVPILEENRTLATISFQNLFRLYNKLSGMTGTAETEAEEFMKTYKLDVTVIPTNWPCIRIDNQDVVYKSEREKFTAIVDEILDCQKRGQPCLVGTVSVEKSEAIHRILSRKGIEHNVLNAKHHESEAYVVAQAGRKSAVTVATNMAGRGTDIILGGNAEMMARGRINPDEDPGGYRKLVAEFKRQCELERNEVIKAGGLHILGTERHESRRIDNQLRGRAGRQGDPGSSRFFLSLEDDLLRIFGAERLGSIMDKLGMEDGVPIEHKMVTKSIENAQKKVEGNNFDIRKNLLEYDDVMNQQRKTIYALRRQILEGQYMTEVGLAEVKNAGDEKNIKLEPVEVPKEQLEEFKEQLKDILKNIIIIHSKLTEPQTPPADGSTPQRSFDDIIETFPEAIEQQVYAFYGSKVNLGQLSKPDDIFNKLMEEVPYSLGAQRERLLDDCDKLIATIVDEFCPGNNESMWALDEVEKAINAKWGIKISPLSESSKNIDDIIKIIFDEVEALVLKKEKAMGKDVLINTFRQVYLQEIDRQWLEHLAAMEQLRSGIGLRGYGNKDPKQEYKREGYDMFVEMMHNINANVIEKTFHVRIETNEDAWRISLPKQNRKLIEGKAENQGAPKEKTKPTTVKRDQPKIGRNDPCPCGSGKKYKKCCGMNR
jgi:preprotein translocase subunit SecA